MSNTELLTGNEMTALFNALPSGVVWLDGLGRVASVNPAAQSMLGEPLLGEAWAQVIERVFAPQPDDGLHHLIVLRFEALGGLDLELHRIINAIARGGQQFHRLLGAVFHRDRRIIGVVFRGLQRVDLDPIA